MPTEAGQGKPALGIHGNPLGQQQVALDPIAALAAGGDGDAAPGIHHPVPGDGGGKRQAAQGPAHLAGPAPGPQQLSDLAVGSQLGRWNPGHELPHPLIPETGGSTASFRNPSPNHPSPSPLSPSPNPRPNPLSPSPSTNPNPSPNHSPLSPSPLSPGRRQPAANQQQRIQTDNSQVQRL